MKNNLTLEINDFGPINRAKIDINQITVIAGVNSSGKSTSSKLLYSLLGSISHEGNTVCYRKIMDMLGRLDRNLSLYEENFKDIESIRKMIKQLKDENLKDKETLNSFKEALAQFEEILDDSEIKSLNFKLLILKSILAINNFQINKTKIISSSQLLLYDEYYNEKEIFEKWNSGLIKLYDSNVDFELNINLPLDGEKSISLNNGDFYLNDIFYMETPFILDLTKRYRSCIPLNPEEESKKRLLHHHNSLIQRLYSTPSNKIKLDKDQTTLDLDDVDDPREAILKYIDEELIGGNIYYDDELYKDFVYEEGEYTFNMRATATGVKTIGILKALVERNLDTNSIIIMDEPEVHLHPEWQLKLVKLIFKIATELNIRFFINTHSPQFLEALEVYSLKYNMDENCTFGLDNINYYLTKYDEESKKYNFNKINHSNLHEIYNHLAKPYFELEKLRGELDAQELNKEM